MRTYLKSLLIMVAVAGLYVPTTAKADFYDYNHKVGPQLGRGSSQSARRSRSMYRSTAPVIVRAESAPNAVAQAPTSERSFSYDPSQPTVSGGCEGTVATEQAPATAQRSTDSGRSFSYEPSMSDSFSAPSMQPRTSGNSRRPAYLLQKTDPNKYRSN
jgi:hypothetical protein